MTMTAELPSAQARILVVEDDPSILLGLRMNLSAEGYEVGIAEDGKVGLERVLHEHWDVVILDVMLPKLNGFEVVTHIRATGNDTPVLMLSAKSAEADKVMGLELGAEDYITKPFSPRELVARAKSAMRRAKGQAPPTGPAPYKGKHLFVDFDAISIRVDNAAITLTRREFELLKFLIENRNRVISRDRLLERVWGFDLEIETRSVDVHVSRLRGKLGAAGKQIETVIGMGYRFSDLAEA